MEKAWHLIRGTLKAIAITAAILLGILAAILLVSGIPHIVLEAALVGALAALVVNHKAK